MLSKKVLKDIQSLGLKKQRAEQGLFLAEGPKSVGELLQLVPEQVVEVFATQEWMDAGHHFPSGIAVTTISEEELDRISQMQSPNQVLAVIKQWQAPRPERVSGLMLYLDAIRDPGNLGTIIRIADWFGIRQVVCSEGCAELFNPKVVQATMGSIARVQTWYDLNGEWITAQYAPMLAAALDGRPVYGYAPPEDALLLIGNESKGLRPALMQRATEKITIPRIGGAESLNAAVATGIILSHLRNK